MSTYLQGTARNTRAGVIGVAVIALVTTLLAVPLPAEAATTTSSGNAAAGNEPDTALNLEGEDPDLLESEEENVDLITAVSPARIAETRTGANKRTVDGLVEGAGRVLAGEVLEVPVLGRGGVPDEEVAVVVLNVTAVNPAASGFLTVYPCAEERPLASNVNYVKRRTVANAVFVQVGSTGSICVYSSTASDVVVDVNGWAEDGALTGVAPARIAETRTGANKLTVDGLVEGVGRVPARGVLEVPVLDRGGVPGEDVELVVLNVTAVNAERRGHFTVYPCGEDRPGASNVNFVPGRAAAAAVLAQVDATGSICVYSSTASDVVVDVNGWAGASSSLTAVSPARIAETRTGENKLTVDGLVEGVGRVPARGVLEVPVLDRGGVPGDLAGSVVLSVVAVNPQGGGHLTVYPCGEDRPLASNVNYKRGDTVANAVFARVGKSGAVCIYSSAATHVVVDVNGWAGIGLNQLSNDVSILTEPGDTTLLAGGLETGAATFVLSAEKTGKVAVGAVIVTMTEDGPFYGEVTSVSPDGDTVAAAEVSFFRVIPNPEFSVTADAATGEVTEATGAVAAPQGIRAATPMGMRAATPMGMRTATSKVLDGTSIECGGGEYITGATYKIELGDTKVGAVPGGWRIALRPEVTVSAELGAEVSCSASVALWTKPLPAIKFAIGGVPVYVTQEFGVDFEIEFSNDSSDTRTVGMTVSGEVGIRCTDQPLTVAALFGPPPCNYINDFSGDYQNSGPRSYEWQATLGVSLTYEAKLFDVTGFYAGVRAALVVGYDPDTQTSSGVFAIDIIAGLKFKLWPFFNYSLPVLEVRLVELVLWQQYWGPVECVPNDQVSVSDCEALAALYRDTYGPGWKSNDGWATAADPCTWYGVTCDDGITGLDLANNNLEGQLPPEIGALTDLTYLNLASNKLSGQVPVEVGNLANVTYLNLASNKLSGEVSPSITYIDGLESLSLWGNECLTAATKELDGYLSDFDVNWDSGCGSDSADGLFECVPNDRVSATECAALADLYLSTGGPEWHNNTNWGTGIDPCSWDGVECSDTKLESLNLQSNNLTGVVPASVTQLSNLESLSLWGNDFTEEVPEEVREAVQDLNTLEFLEDAVEFLEDPVDPCTWYGVGCDADGLNRLDLSSNNLVGEIPISIGDFKNLVYMDFSDNYLSGEIPVEIMNLTKLEDLILSGNGCFTAATSELADFLNSFDPNWDDGCESGPGDGGDPTGPGDGGDPTGPGDGGDPTGPGDGGDPTGPGDGFTCVPTDRVSVTECESLEAIYQSTNGDNWSTNDGWGTTADPCTWYGVICSETSLISLNLANNGMYGAIPAEIGNLTNLEELNLFANSLSGEIPAEIWNLTNLTNLNLSYNILSGEIPAEIGNLTNLDQLDLYRNSLSGEIPAEIGNLTNLDQLDLGGNSLSGEIPAEIGNLTNLDQLDLGGNSLSGEIPAEIGNLTNLFELDLRFNSLSGEIPAEIGNLTNLDQLDLGGNSLSGEIPAEIGNLTNLFELDLYRNSLSGEIPAEIGNLTSLTSLALSGNSLSGEIPAEIGNLTNLTNLNLYDNSLSGEIPAEIGNLTNLSVLRLYGNGCLTAETSRLAVFLIIYDPLWNRGCPTGPGDGGDPTGPGDGGDPTGPGDGGDPTGPGDGGDPTGPGDGGDPTGPGDGGDPTGPGDGGDPTGPGDGGDPTGPGDGGDPTGPGDGGDPTGPGDGGDPTGPGDGGDPTGPGDGGDPTGPGDGGDPTGPGDGGDPTGPGDGGDPTGPGDGGDPTGPGDGGDPTGPGDGFTCVPTDRVSVTECESLEAIYQSTNGDNWSTNDGWGTTADPCTWYGVACDVDGLNRLDFADQFVGGGNSLSGEIPAEIGNLTNLTYLDLSGNSLSGEIPAEIWNLTNLTYLDLNGDSLSGEIPAEIGNLTNLTYLDLSINSLTGEIPAEIGNLTNLTNLILYGNSLSGEIPAEIGNLANLGKLDLTGNSLSGEIPAEIGNLTNLSRLYLSNNQLSGEIPAEIGNLTNLFELNLSYNSLTGEIPTQIGDFEFLGYLDLSGNELSGEIPAAIGNIIYLEGLDLSNNNLSGEIPAEISNLTGLFALNLDGNGCLTAETSSLADFLNIYDPYWNSGCPTGPGDGGDPTGPGDGGDPTGPGDGFTCVPTDRVSVTECESLEAIYQSTNGDNWNTTDGWGTTADPCTWYGVACDVDGLISLDLTFNSLSGEIPAEIGNLTNLTNLYLSYNSLSGEIPAEIGNLTNLTYLDLDGNSLSGEIPAEIGNLTNLTNLYLSYNSLAGEIPAEIGNLTNLGQLGLSANNLTGEIPAEIGNLTNLFEAQLDFNSLSGEIPAEIGNLTNLSYLGLYGNGCLTAETSSLADFLNIYDPYWNSGCPTGPGDGGDPTGPGDGGDPTGPGDGFTCVPTDRVSVTECESLEAIYQSTNGDNWSTNDGWGTTADPCTWYGVECSETSLISLNLANNGMYGAIPAEIGNLTNLEELNLFANSLSGEIPAEIGNLTNLTNLTLSYNSLSGEIPAEIWNLTNLTNLYLSGNSLSGEIPAEIGSLTNLTNLYLSSNSLSGEIPAEIGNLTNLEGLDLSSNNLSGEIPAEIGNLTNLFELNLSDNELSGIPAEIGNLTNLAFLNLGSNSLSGEVPAEIGNLTNLFDLNLGGSGCLTAANTDLENFLNTYDEAWQGTGTCPLT